MQLKRLRPRGAEKVTAKTRLAAGFFGVLLLLLTSTLPAFAGPAAIQDFFIPLPEEQVRTWGLALDNTLGEMDEIHSVISVTATFDATVIYFDHWEDGFEADISNPTQSTTEVFGDGDASNGAPPGCLLDACDTVDSGDVFALEDDVPANPRDQGNIFYDGGDKVASSELIVITRAAWPSAGVQAQVGGAVEVFSVDKWDTDYESPVGTDLGVQGFEYVAFSISAEEDGTTVDVDIDADGASDLTQTLSQGESLLVEGISVGATVSADADVQVDILSGESPSGWNGRWYSLVPTADWGDTYYSPVGPVNGITVHAYLYNPGAAAITVNVDESSGTTPVVVGAGASVAYLITNNAPTSSARFTTPGNEPFFAVVAIDRDNNVHDWGFTLIPEISLTPSVVVGWAPGTTDLARTASPVWVMHEAAVPTTIYIDYDGDPTTGALVDPAGNRYDTSSVVGPLNSLRITDAADEDMTGARIYTVDNTRIAAAWGQDPSVSGSGQPTELDLGTTVLPFTSLTAFKTGVLYGDFDDNGGLDPGEILLYTVRVHNSGIIPLSNINLTDTLDPNTTYVADTTEIGGVPIADDTVPPAATRFPLDEGGYLLVDGASQLQPGADIFITFQATVNDPFPAGVDSIVNSVLVSSDAEIIVDAETNPVREGELSITKASSHVGTDVLPNDPVNYTITVENISSVVQTGIEISDPLPSGVTYVAASTSITGPQQIHVKDVFDQLTYSNQDGPSDWDADWAENDAAGGGATAGDVQVINGELRMEDSGSNASRLVDLSAFGGTTPAAYVSFDWRIAGGVDRTDIALVEVSSTGGAPFTTLATITGIDGNGDPSLRISGNRAYDISTFISANTTVRFSVTGYDGGTEFFYVDDVTVRAADDRKRVADTFTVVSYANDNGDPGDLWAADWIENDASGAGAGAGDVQVIGGELRMEDGDSSAEREIDLSVATGPFAFAFLTFDWRLSTGVDTTDEVTLEISSDGGASWTDLEVFTAIDGDAGGYETAAARGYDISSHMSATTRVRFRIGGGSYWGGTEFFYVDNVEIVAGLHVPVTKDNIAAGANPDLVDGVPGDLLLPLDDIALAPGETLTLTFQTTANDPVGVTRVVNTATTTSYEGAPPASDRAIDDVSTGGAAGDQVWLDSNGDGVFDVGEPGLSNVDLELWDTGGDGVIGGGDDVLVATTTSNAGGGYLFSGIVPGTYFVDVVDATVPAGLILSPGITDPSATFTVTNTEQFLDVDFGYRTPAGAATIGDYVWSDADNDGIQDAGEAGLGGIVMALSSDPGADLTWGTSDDTIAATTTTAADGSYLFTSVAAGGYRVVCDVGPDGIPANGDELLVAGGYTPSVGPHSVSAQVSGLITTTGGETITDIDFGWNNPGLSTVSDRIWFDLDSDGVQDTGEPGIFAVTVNLLDASGSIVATTATDASGDFSFAGVADGNYTIEIEDSGGELIGYAGTTAEAVAGQKAVVVAGADVSAVSFGYNAPGVIGDLVWSDTNGDGVRDPGESGVEAVIVELYEDTNGNGVFDPGTDAFVDTTATDAVGGYNFQVNTPGIYFVSIDPTDPGQPAFIAAATLTTTDDEPTASGDQQQVTLLDIFASALTADFGYQGAAGTTFSLSGNVFNDTDNNGTDDGITDPGVESVTVDLIGPGGDGILGTGDDIVLSTTATDANGDYSFAGLLDGDYRIQVTDTLNVFDGFSLTTPANDYVDVTVSGADIPGNDFGYYKAPTRVMIASFTACESRGGSVVAAWQTAAEHNTAGFTLYRRGETGRFVLLHNRILPGLINAPQGGTYRFLDDGADPGGTLTYLLVEREMRGARNTYGPFTVEADPCSGTADTPPSGYSRTARVTPSQPLSLQAAPLKMNASGGDAIRITVTGEGLYFVPAAEIALLLEMPERKVRSRIRRGRFALESAGQDVSWAPAKGGDGIYFYGQGIDSTYTTENAYLLFPGKGRTMKKKRGGRSAGSPGDSFTDTVHLEVDRDPGVTFFSDPDADYWLWEYIIAGDSESGKRTFPFDAPGADAAGTGSLTVHLLGITSSVVAQEHHISASLNGEPVGEARFDGIGQSSSTFPVREGLLKESGNVVELTGLLDTGAELSYFYVDSIDVAYDRLFRAVDDSLLFAAGDSPVVTIRGFTLPGIVVLDLTDPLRPVRMKNALVAGDGPGFSVTFTPSSPDTPYLAAAKEAARDVAGAVPFSSTRLRRSGNRGEYVIVTTDALKATAAVLAGYRESQGLSAMVVGVDDIMNEFNSGLYAPEAVTRFLRHALKNWKKPPRYLVLAGEGSYDYRGLMGTGDNLVPTLMVPTPYGLFPSDNALADTDGDHIPDVAVGRLPVVSPGELQTVIDKIIAYETGAGGGWTKEIVLAADDPDAGGNFPLGSDLLAAAIPPEYSVQRIYLSEMSPGEARQALLERLGSGLFLVNWIGHAGLDRLADEKILLTGDVASLNNGERLPVMTAMTCYAGNYGYPGYDSLGEALLLREGGGAAALWAPTGLSRNDQALLLSQALFEKVFVDGWWVLGDAVLEALETCDGIEPFMLDIYNILGDPALRLR